MADTLRQLTDQEITALDLLDNAPDAFTGMAAAARETGLSHEQIREANSLRAARRRTNGGVSVAPFLEAGQTLSGVPVVDAPLPDPTQNEGDNLDSRATVEQMLKRADRIGSVRARHLADRIGQDVQDLRETLAEDEVALAARNRLKTLAAQRAVLDDEIAKLNALLRPPTAAKPGRSAVAKKNAKKRPAGKRRAAAANTLLYSPAIREWAKTNWDGVVSERGRLSNAIITAYQAAQGAESTSGSVDS